MAELASPLLLSSDPPLDGEGDPEPEALLEQAYTAHLLYSYPKADALYRRALALDPTLVTGRVWHAILLAERGQTDAAATELARALEVDAEAAAERLTVAYQQDHASDAILSLLGRLAWQTGDPASAREWFNRALRQNPDSVTARAWAGVLTPTVETVEDGVTPLPVASAEPTEPTESPPSLESPPSGDAEPPATPPPPDPVELRRTVREARQLMTAGELDAAERELRAGRLRFPDDDEIVRLLDEVERQRLVRQRSEHVLREAQARVEDGQPQAALSLLELALKDDPFNATLRQTYDSLKAQQHHLQEVRRWLTETRAALRRGEVDQAREALARLAALAPDVPEVAQLRAELDRRDQAAQAIETVVRQVNEAAAAGRLLDARRLLETARQQYPQAPQLDAAQHALWQTLEARVDDLRWRSREAEGAEQLDQALAYYQEAQALLPEREDLHTLADAVQRRVHDRDEALSFETAARQAYRAGRPMDAENLLRQAMSLLPDRPDWPALLRQWEAERRTRDEAERRRVEAVTHEEAGDDTGALKAWHAALNLLPHDPALRQAYTAFEERRQARQAAAERAEKIRQLLAEVDHMVGQGRYDEAAQRLNAAETLDPQHPGLAECRARLTAAREDDLRRRRAEALALLERARRLAPTDPEGALELVGQAEELAAGLPESAEVRGLAEATRRTQREVQQRLDSIEALRTEHKLVEARRAVQQAQRDYPQELRLRSVAAAIESEIDAEVAGWLKEGQVAEGRGQFDHALAAYAAALALRPGHPAATAAQTALRDRLARDAEATRRLAEAERHYGAGDLAAALPALDGAIALWPQDPSLVERRAAWQRELEQSQLSEPLADEAPVVDDATSGPEPVAVAPVVDDVTPEPEPVAVAPAVDDLTPGPEPVATLPTVDVTPRPEPVAVAPAMDDVTPGPEPVAVAPVVDDGTPQPEPVATTPTTMDVAPGPESEAVAPVVEMGPDEAIAEQVRRGMAAWRAGDRAACLAAFEPTPTLLAGATTQRASGLQASLVYLGLILSGSRPLAEDERRRLSRLAEDLERGDRPLRDDFNAHLLSHLVHAVVTNSRDPLENLALQVHSRDSAGEALIDRIARRTTLDAAARRLVYDRLAARAEGEMGEIVLYTLGELLEVWSAARAK